MTIPLTINGTTYNFPASGDENWGNSVTSWAAAVTANLFPLSGGNYFLTGELNWGPNYGHRTVYIRSDTANPASVGFVRLATADAIYWRANDGVTNLPLTINGSNALTFNGQALLTSSSVGSNSIDVGQTGSVSRQLNDKLADAVSAKDFGVVGDGVTDDTVAMQAAITFACTTRKTLLINRPSVRYRITSTLNLTGRYKIVGEGMGDTILFWDSASGYLFTETADCTYSYMSDIQAYGHGRNTGEDSSFYKFYEGAPGLYRIFERVYHQEFGRYGYVVNDSFSNVWRDCRMRRTGTTGTLAAGGTDGYGGHIQLIQRQFSGAASTGNIYENTYMTGSHKSIFLGNSTYGSGATISKVFNTLITMVLVEENYIGIDLKGDTVANGGTGISRYCTLNTVYFEANLFAGANMGSGVAISCYQNNTTPGTGIPPSWSTDGPDGIVWGERYMQDRPSKFEVGNGGSGSNGAVFTVSKNEPGWISNAMFSSSAIKFVNPGTGLFDNQQIFTVNTDPKGTLSARVGSLALNRTTQTYSAVYVKGSGAPSTNDWWQLHERRFGTTASRPTPGTDGTGALYFNTTTNKMQVWDGAAWADIATGLSGTVVLGNGTVITGDFANINNTPIFKGNTGTATNLQVVAPSGGSGDRASVRIYGGPDQLNSQFMGMRSYSVDTSNRIIWGTTVAGVANDPTGPLTFSGASSFGTYATVRNGSTPTAASDLTRKDYVDGLTTRGPKVLATLATAFNVTISNATATYINAQTGTLATGTFTLPASPVDGQFVTLHTAGQITSLTINPNAGQTIQGTAITAATAAAGATVQYIYHLASTTWYRLL